MERFLEPIELNDDELAAVAGGLLNFSNSLNNFANVSNAANNSANNSTASGTNATNVPVAAAVPVIV